MSCNSFEEVKLVDICDLISRGITPSYTEDKSEGVIVLNQKCIRDNTINLELSRLTNPNKKKITENKYLKQYDILVNSTGVGTLGRVAQVKELNEKMTVDSHVTIVRPKKEVNPIFLGYNLFMQQRYIESLGEGSTGQTELSRVRLGEALKVKLPPLEEQEKIANILSSLDDKIELNNDMNKTLEEMAQSIFKRWFIDFEFPNEDGEPYKSSGGEMVDSELGMIPKGWEVKMIKHFGKIVTGKTPSTKNKDNYGDKYPFITIPDMHNTMFISKSDRYLSEDGHCSQPKKLIPKNSIIVSCIATVGLVAINLIDSHTNQQINSVIPSNESLVPYLYFNIKDKKEYLNLLGSSGTTTINVNKTLFESIKIISPQEHIIEKFYEVIYSTFKQIEKNILENENLEKTRDILLDKLMSGEIRVN